MVEICTGGRAMLYFALAGSADRVQTNGLRFQARQRYASKAAVLCVQSHFFWGCMIENNAHQIGEPFSPIRQITFAQT
jgi:hypothetical protein